jgi:hypothetical protein
MAQPVFNEHAVIWLRRAWIERREGENVNWAASRRGFDCVEGHAGIVPSI